MASCLDFFFFFFNNVKCEKVRLSEMALNKIAYFPWERTFFGKNTKTQSLTAMNSSIALESVPAQKCQSVTKKMGIYVTEEIYTIDGESGLIILSLFSRRWIHSFRATLLSLNRKLSGTSGMTAQAVWRQPQILPGRIGNDCSKRSLSKCSHTKTNLSRLCSDKHVAPFHKQPVCFRHLAHFTVCVIHTSNKAITHFSLLTLNNHY